MFHVCVRVKHTVVTITRRSAIARERMYLEKEIFEGEIYSEI